MSDLISRSALLEALKDEQNDGAIGMDFYAFDDIVKEQPTIEAVPVDRNRIIDEFAQKAIERLEDMGCEAWRRDIMAIAEEMKGGAE